ncbi:Transcriptional regulator, AraC family [Labilithrix luteola]|uniref:Transcriptional regulator, AraC family n=1 Tax=Labilithrix luteola TaxID=1391654 RepID=A0A0K1PK91_9BACT|nr:helix-turn-helix domain-containing protein [Labilithrix luteola]AKU93937.1 Transcriptional regulator, AraC family [Labilithrix luteola]
MASKPPVHTIGILSYPGAQQATVYGLVDLFEVANRRQAGREGATRIETVVLRGNEKRRKSDAPLTALIVPPSLDGYRQIDDVDKLAAWMTARHEEGTLLCSVCVGSFLLAETGLLAGRPATTHWALKEQFAGRFPDVALDTDKLLVDDGDIITAGGIMAWVDLGLRLVGRLAGPTVLLDTARYFLVDPGGREQRFYSTFAPSLTHGDAQVLKVQHWLQTKFSTKVTLPAMARHAALGERTFLRRFHKATGMKPTEYVQHLRVVKAREMLELSNATIDEIAHRVGYEDVGGFRQVFQKLMGLSLGEYRRRFAPTAGRS